MNFQNCQCLIIIYYLYKYIHFILIYVLNVNINICNIYILIKTETVVENIMGMGVLPVYDRHTVPAEAKGGCQSP